MSKSENRSPTPEDKNLGEAIRSFKASQTDGYNRDLLENIATRVETLITQTFGPKWHEKHREIS